MNTCPMCGGAVEPWLAVPCDALRPQDRERRQLYRCGACDYGMLLPRPTPQECAAFYDFANYYTHATTSNGPAAKPSLPRRIREHLAWRIDHGQAMSGDYFNAALPDTQARICDVGCGNGHLARQLLDLGHDVTGVEIDPAARQAAQSTGLHVVAGTAEDLPPELFDKPFDVAVMSHVLEHCIDPMAALRNVRRLLREGGQLFCEVPNNAALTAERLGVTWAFLDVPRHLNFFTPQSLNRMAEQCGFDVQRVEYTGCNRQFFDDRIRSEQHLHDVYREASEGGAGGGGEVRLPPRHNAWRVWRMLAAVAMTNEPRRYDSVRIIASPSPGR